MASASDEARTRQRASIPIPAGPCIASTWTARHVAPRCASRSAGLDADVVSDARSRSAGAAARSELLAEAQVPSVRRPPLRSEVAGPASCARAGSRVGARALRPTRFEGSRARGRGRGRNASSPTRGRVAAMRDELRPASRVRRESDQDRASAPRRNGARAERALGDLSAAVARDRAARGRRSVDSTSACGTIVSIRGDEAEVVGATGPALRIRCPGSGLAESARPRSRAPWCKSADCAGDASDQLECAPGRAGGARGVRRLVDDAALAASIPCGRARARHRRTAAKAGAKSSRRTRSSNAARATPTTGDDCLPRLAVAFRLRVRCGAAARCGAGRDRHTTRANASLTKVLREALDVGPLLRSHERDARTATAARPVRPRGAT